TELRQPDQNANFSTSCATMARPCKIDLTDELDRRTTFPATFHCTRICTCAIVKRLHANVPRRGPRLPPACAPLPDGFDERNTRRDRHIEAFNVSAHPDRDEPTAPLPHQPPQASAFRS